MMKSKLYALAAAALFGLNANAQGLANGDYYIKNVESGKFLSNGASWGTRSVLSDNGICYGVSKGADGKYTLISGIKGDTKALRPSDGFNDQSGAWDLIFEDDVVYMYNGSKYFCNDASNLPQFTDTKNDAAKWQFISKAQLLENLGNASKSNPVDASFLITGADFHNADVKNSAWSKSKVGGEYGSGCTLVNSSNCEQWKGGNVDISQTITVPNGIYKLSVLGYTREGGLAAISADVFENNTYTKGYLYANDKEVELSSIFANYRNENTAGFSGLCTSTSGKAYYIPNSQGDAAVCFDQDLYRSTVDVVVDKETLKLGVKVNGVEWLVIDKFRLTYYGPASDEVALNSAKEGYNTALTNAKAVDVAAKMNADVKTALINAISTNDNLNSTDPQAYNDAKSALATATDNATKSINAYAAVASKISVLDAAGKANFNASEVGKKYVNNTYENEDITAAFIAAVKAQTSEGADMSALAPATWACAQGNGPTPQQGGFETFNSPTAFAAGKVMSQTISDLNKGLYKVEIQYLTHLADWNGQVGSGEGIAQIYANDATIDVEVIADKGGSIQPITIEALVKDGTLEYGIQNIADGGCWYVAKFEKLTYVRPLTAAEEAVAPTSITLNAASAALKPGQQTTLSVAAFKPDDATATVTWSSSDNNVATVNDGVVTAVGEGTATITATSAIDTSIKATATVTVAYPTELANASFDEADVATADLGTNGSAANTMAVSDWTSKGGVWTAGAAFAYGNAVKLNGADIPAADETHKGNALGVSVGWGAEVVFSQTIKLPAGNYIISVDAYNANKDAVQGASKLGFVSAGASYISDKKSFAIGEWETDKVTFKLTEATVGQIQIGLGAISGGSRANAKVFFDNIVIATKTDAEIEAEQAAAAAKALADAKAAKKADFDKLAVGDDLFYYSAANVAAAKANVDKAATIEEVANVAAPVANAPQAGKAYAIKNNTADGYLTIASEGIKVTKNAPVYFEAVDGGYVLSNGEEYLSKKGGDTWTLNTTTDNAAALKVNVVINNGQYEIKNANGSLGLDNTDSGSLIFANKNAATNGLWTIEDWAAPAPEAIEIAHGTKAAASTEEMDITYKRNFAVANKWQSLYVPFSIDMTEVKDVIIAQFDDVAADGDEVTISISKVTTGTIPAQTPLFIAAVTAGDKSIKTGVSTIESAVENSTVIGAASVTGILSEPKAGINGNYIMSGGNLCYVPESMSSIKLGVNHWYMSLSVPSAKIRINAVGFDTEEATGIASAIAESLGAKAYSINGTQVDASNAKGVYIQNGKKFIRK